MTRRFILAIVLLGLCHFPAELKAIDSVLLKPVADTLLRKEFPQDNYGAYSQIDFGDEAEGKGRVSLIKFGLSTLPKTGTVTHAILRLKTVKPHYEIFELRRLLRDWAEGDKYGSPAGHGEATWNSARHGLDPWTLPGGQHEGTDIATVQSGNFGNEVRAGLVFTADANMLADIERWRTAPQSNYGWMIRQIPRDDRYYGYGSFFSSEHIAAPPELEVYFGDPNAPKIFVNHELVDEQGLDFGSPIMVDIQSPFTNSLVYFTVDGTEPTLNSPRHWGGRLDNSMVLRVLNYSSDFSRVGMSPPIPFRRRPAYTAAAYSPAGGYAYLSGGNLAPRSVYGLDEYFEDSVFHLTAVPAPGATFRYWKGPVTDTNAAITTMSLKSNTVATAIFAYPQPVTIQGQGTVTLDPPTGLYDVGSKVALTPIPHEGYYFAQWAYQGSAAGINVPFSITITDGKPVAALFLPLGSQQATLTLRTEGGGTAARSPVKNVYAFGESVTLTAQPKAGFRFVRWRGDAVGTNSTNSTISVALKPGSNIVTAEFEGHFQVGARKTVNGVTLKLNADSGFEYLVQRSTDLRTWRYVGTLRGSGPIEKTYPMEEGTNAFYRVQIVAN